MALSDNERIQEMVLVTRDKVALVDRKLWYALGITIVALIPAYYVFKLGFMALMMRTYNEPQIIYSPVVKAPLQILDKKIFALPNNTYSGYVKIKNTELEWGVNAQPYTVEFKTFGGTSLSKSSRITYILPAKEKIIVLPRFSSTQKPDEIVFTLGPTQFVHKPETDFSFELERDSFVNPPTGLRVSAGIKNTTAFTIKQIDLPVVVYDNKNQIVAVNFTYINDVLSGETRTFQYSWPVGVTGAAREEITPEINIFDRNMFDVPAPSSPVDELQE